MKKVFLFLLLVIFISGIASAQSKQTVYCKMTINDIPKRQKIFIDFGTSASASFFKDTVITSDLIKARSFTNGVDAINYMNTIGWELITIISRSNDYTCFYKKEIDK